MAQFAAQNLGANLLVMNASSEGEIETVFATLVDQQARALLVTGDPLFNGTTDKHVGLAARHAIPTVCQYPQFAAACGLMGYGASLADRRLLAVSSTGRRNTLIF